MTHLRGKTAVVLGVADRESIAWSIACELQKAGAQVTIGYQHKFYSRIHLLLKEEPSITGQRCDILNPDEVERFFQLFQETGIDVLVHSIAFGSPSVFTDEPSQVMSPDFSEMVEVSAYSLAKAVRYSKTYLEEGASVMALTFQASQRAMPMYGMMGVAKATLESLIRYLAVELGPRRIRVNAISAGPVETLAALHEVIAFRRSPESLNKLRSPWMSEIFQAVEEEFGREGGDEPGTAAGRTRTPAPQSAGELPRFDDLEFARRCWSKIQAEFARRSAIPDRVDAKDIAQCAVFLASDGASKITGQVIHVDCGFSTCLLF